MMNDDWTPGCDVKADVPDDQKGRHYDVFEEVAILAQQLATKGLLETLRHQIRLVRGHFGYYDPIDFLVLLLGYAISGERTLADFFERLSPFGPAFMALFGRTNLPHRSSLSRFLADVGRPCARSLS